MLEDGFSSDKYIAVLGNLREGGFLDKEDVQNLTKEFMTTQKISLMNISDAKVKILSEALIDNFNRLKSKKRIITVEGGFQISDIGVKEKV